MKKNLAIFLPLFLINVFAGFVFVETFLTYERTAMWKLVFALLGFIIIFSFSVFIVIKISQKKIENHPSKKMNGFSGQKLN